MNRQHRAQRPRISRRDLLRAGGMGAGVLALGPLLAACGQSDEELIGDGPGASASPGAGGGDGDGGLVWLSTQLSPVEEAEAVRNSILAGFDQPVEFVGDDVSFIDRVVAQAEAGDVTTSLLGGLHGDFATLVERDLLMDLSDLGDELSDRGFNEDYLELAGFGGDGLFYIPWMQATYILAARTEALELLPGGADIGALTYEQWAQWGQAIADAGEGQRLGLPASDEGLLHRFFQGYAYPSFTGALNTQFSSGGAADMWAWLRELWPNANPQSSTYGYMQEPLRSGEVWIAWDHVARLVDALRAEPDAFTAFPAPVGPQGLGFMPVVAGLAIPNGAPAEQAARDLIAYLTTPETTQVTLAEVGFYPPFAGELELGGDLDPGIVAQAEAVQAMTSSPDAIPSLLPIGLGEQDGAYNDVFRTAFETIVINGADVQQTLDEQAATLQGVLDEAGAACWQPDPEGDGVCQVG